MIKVTVSRYIKFRREKVNFVNKSMRTNTMIHRKVRVGKVEVGPESPGDCFNEGKLMCGNGADSKYC